MRPLKRNRVTLRSGIVAVATTMVLTLSSTSTGHTGLAVFAASGDGLQNPAAPVAANHDDTSIRPFTIHVPDEALVDLHRRLAATRWPDNETVTDQSQGVQLATMKELVRYWQTDYDWRKAEAKLNALPQFVTTIDGLDIHFIHVRSKHDNALPLIVTHGWPGSIIEELKIIDRLTNPTAYGGSASDAFHVVIPSMPGYGFSGKPTTTGWNTDRIARAWDTLMKRLGYTRYVSQGGDWGARICEAMAHQAPQGLLGVHMNLLLTFPPEIARAFAAGEPPPQGLSEAEKAAYEQRRALNPIGYSDRCRHGARRPLGTVWRNRPSAWPPGCSTTTPTVTSKSHTPLKDTPRVPLRETRSSTTSRCTGSRTPGPRPRGSTGRRRASSTRGKFPFRPPLRCSPASSIVRHGVGSSVRSRTSFTSTRWTRAATSRRGSSRSCSLKRFEQPSDRCESWTNRALDRAEPKSYRSGEERQLTEELS